MTKVAFAQFLTRSGAPYKDAEVVSAHLVDRLTARQPLTEQEWSIVYEAIQRADGASPGPWLSDLAGRAGRLPQGKQQTPPGVPVPYPTFGSREKPQRYEYKLPDAMVSSYGMHGSASGPQITRLAASLHGAGRA